MRDELADLIEGARSAARRNAFSLANTCSMGLKSGTVGRQKADARADRFDRGADLRLFVHGEVVEDDDIAGPQRRHQHLLDVRQEARVVDRPIEDGRRRDRRRAVRRR